MVFVKKRPRIMTDYSRRLAKRILLGGMAVLACGGVALAGLVRNASTTVKQSSQPLNLNWEAFDAGSTATSVEQSTPRPPKYSMPSLSTAYPARVRRASKNAYRLDLRGDGLITFTIDAATAANISGDGEALGINNSVIRRDPSGRIVLTPATVSKIVPSVVNLDGVIDADAISASKTDGWVLIRPSRP